MSHEADRSDPFAADPIMNDRADWRADTITSFPAIRGEEELEPQPAPDVWQECPCGSGKPLAECDGQVAPAEPGKGFLLYCGPGVVSRMWRTRITNGQYDDIPSMWDDAYTAVHIPAVRHQRLIHAELAARRHDIAVMFTRRQDLLSDAVIADGLHDLESRLASRLEDMQAEAAERQAAA